MVSGFVVAAVAAVLLGLFIGTARNCILDHPNATASHNRTERVPFSRVCPSARHEDQNYLTKYKFNFTTVNDYSIVGTREVLYCDSIKRNDTLCDKGQRFARSIFISSRNVGTSTNRLSSAVYDSLEDFLNNSMGTVVTDESWNRLNEAVESSGRVSFRDNLRLTSHAVQCSHNLVYGKLRHLIELILHSSSTILSDSKVLALARMLQNVPHKVYDQEENTVIQSRVIIDRSLEVYLDRVMALVAECTSSAWSINRKCPPCHETIVISSRYPVSQTKKKIHNNMLFKHRG